MGSAHWGGYCRCSGGYRTLVASSPLHVYLTPLIALNVLEMVDMATGRRVRTGVVQANMYGFLYKRDG